MLKLVLDASIAVKWLNHREFLANKANLIRDDYERGHISLVVPAFWEYEIANGLNKAVARGQLTGAEGREAVALLLALPMQKEPIPTPQESYELARG